MRTKKAAKTVVAEDAIEEALARRFLTFLSLRDETLESAKDFIAEKVEDVFQKRSQLKDILKPCFESKMPSTPRHNFRPTVKPRQGRVINFADDDQHVVEPPSTSSAVVRASPQKEQTMTTPVVTQPVMAPSASALKTTTPHRASPSVIPGTPSPNGCRLIKPPSKIKVPRAGKAKKDAEAESRRKQEMAIQKKAEMQRERQERTKHENELRKRRVEENRKKKEMEEAQKKEMHRQKHEEIKRFQEAQRTPEVHRTPAQFRTPGSQAVPHKRVKANTPLSRPKPLYIDPKSQQQPDELTHQENMEPLVSDSQLGMSMDVEHQDRNKENEVTRVPPTPATRSQLNNSAYEMTPDKVPLPSSENDYNVADLSSNDETDNEDEPRKKVPSWAQRDNLQLHIESLRQRLTSDQINAYFGQIRKPNVRDIFGEEVKRNYRKLDETTLWESPIGNPRPAPLMNKTHTRRGATFGHH